MGAVSAALALAAGGNMALAVAAVEPVANAGGSLAPWLTGGGSAAAVAGLVYVARMVVKGDLVPRPVEEREKEQAAAVQGAAERQSRLLELVTDSLAREQVLANLGGEAVRGMTHQARAAAAALTTSCAGGVSSASGHSVARAGEASDVTAEDVRRTHTDPTLRRVMLVLTLLIVLGAGVHGRVRSERPHQPRARHRPTWSAQPA